MPARPALGDDFARYELRENIVAHLATLDCPASPALPWPADSHSPAPLDAPALPLGDVHALQVCPPSLSLSHACTRTPETDTRAQEHARTLREDLDTLRAACTDPSGRLGGLLHGHDPELATIQRLAWLAPLYEPTACLAARDAERVADLLLLSSRIHPEQHAGTPTANAFALLQSLPFFDAGLAASCLPCDHAYELEVARLALRLLGGSPTHDQVALELASGWRRRGLLYPLLLAASHMPTLTHWLPRDLHAESSAKGLEAFLAFVQRPPDSPPALDYRAQTAAALRAFLSTQDLAQPSARAVASLLDRLALAMRVRSSAASPDDHCMRACLAGLASAASLPPHQAWGVLPQALERALPASALCHALMIGMTEPCAWAAPGPRYQLSASTLRLRFAPIRLEPHEGRAGGGQAVPDPRMRQLCALVQRLGRACLSPELSSAVLHPYDTIRALERVPSGTTGKPTGHACPPAALLRLMPAHEPPELQAFAAKRALDLALGLCPVPARAPEPHPAYLLAWRIEGPRHVVLFTGAQAVEPHDILDVAPHTLPRALLPDRSRRPELAEITAWDTAPTEHDIRQAVLRAATAAFRRSGFIERVRGQRAGAQATALEEAVLQFMRPPPEDCHTRGALHSSQPWSDERIDPRYAETQEAANGSRHRDWLCIYAGGDGQVSKCRLEAHIIAVPRLYRARVPLGDGRWATVRSTLPFPHASLLEASGRSLADHVRSRYGSDPDSLPTREPRHAVERPNVTIYAQGGHTLVAYSPLGQDRLEFVSFSMP